MEIVVSMFSSSFFPFPSLVFFFFLLMFLVLIFVVLVFVLFFCVSCSFFFLLPVV